MCSGHGTNGWKKVIALHHSGYKEARGDLPLELQVTIPLYGIVPWYIIPWYKLSVTWYHDTRRNGHGSYTVTSVSTAYVV